MTYTVDLCDGFTKVGEATAFELDAVVRLLQVGEWQLTAPLSGLECPDVGAVDSIIVYDTSTEARIMFGGIVRRSGDVDGGVARVVAAEGTSLEFRGVDVYGLLGQRNVWPTPSTDPPWADAHDLRSGVGSTVAAGYIDANMGGGALAGRQISGVTVIDPAIGTTSTWSGRLQPLDEMVGRICRESGIICLATMTAPGAYRFLFQSANDLSASIVFTDQGDLEELSRLVSPATASHVVAAGQGELAARSFATADSGVTGLDRVEVVYENTNITTVGALTLAASTELILQGEDVSVDGLVAADAAQRVRYLDDYDLGDYLGVEVDSVRYSSQVEAVIISLSAEREVIRPVLGRASTNDALRLIRQVSGLESRFAHRFAERASMASNYPTSLDTTATLPAAGGVGANLSTFPHSALHGNEDDAIIAIETELGVAPSGTYATVKARLDSLIIPDIQIFTGSGTWTKPSGATMVQVIAIGGGGGGGSGRRGASATNRCGGAGGGGGSRVNVTMSASLSAATETVTVGGGGTGGTGISANDTSGNFGNPGTATTFGLLVYAVGGFGGVGGAAVTSNFGGLSGTRLVDNNTGITIGGGHGAGGNVAGTPVTPDAELMNGGGSGGGGGGGIDTANTTRSGGQGGHRAQLNSGGGLGGVAANNPGLAGTATTANLAMGGAGGGGAAAGLGVGGAGALYGGGGGGSGGNLNGGVTGNGGAGAAGIVVVIST